MQFSALILEQTPESESLESLCCRSHNGVGVTNLGISATLLVCLWTIEQVKGCFVWPADWLGSFTNHISETSPTDIRLTADYVEVPLQYRINHSRTILQAPSEASVLSRRGIYKAHLIRKRELYHDHLFATQAETPGDFT